MNYCKTCVYYPPSSCDGKPCTQCDPESPFQNCYVKNEDYRTKERMDERLEMMHKLYPDAKPTNADRIRSMTDEELAEWASIREMCFIYHLLINDPDLRNKCRIYESCKDCWLDWLKQEASDD